MKNYQCPIVEVNHDVYYNVMKKEGSRRLSKEVLIVSLNQVTDTLGALQITLRTLKSEGGYS